MTSNIVLNNRTISGSNLVGNELIFLKRPITIKKSTNNNINNISYINQNEQLQQPDALYESLSTQKKSQSKPQSAVNRTGEFSLHTQGQARNSINPQDKNPYLNDIKDSTYNVRQQEGGQQSVNTQQKQVLNKAGSQRYESNNRNMISSNIMNATDLIKRPPSASQNSKKQQITVFQQQKQSFLSQNQNQKRQSIEQQNYINRGNILSYKQKQKIISELYNQEKVILNENEDLNQNDYPKYLLKESGDVRQIVYVSDQKSNTQRLLKEKNDQKQTNSSRVQAIYQNAIVYNKQSKSNRNLLANQNESKPNALEDKYILKPPTNESSSLERYQQTQNRVYLANTYVNENNQEKTAILLLSQKSLQNLTSNTSNTMQLKQQQQENTNKNYPYTSNQKNQKQLQMLEDITSSSTKKQQNYKNNSRSNSPNSKACQQIYMEESYFQDDEYQINNQQSVPYVEIYANDLSKFKQKFQNYNDSKSAIHEELADCLKYSTNSLDSFRKQQQRNMAQQFQYQILDKQQIRNQQFLLKQKSTKSKKSGILKNSKGQSENSKIVIEIDENKLQQLRYKLLENNDKILARKILVKKKSISKQKSGYAFQSDTQLNTERDINEQKLQKSIINNTTQQVKRTSKRISIKSKKSDSNQEIETQIETTNIIQSEVPSKRKISVDQKKLSENRRKSYKKPPLPQNSASKVPPKGQGEEGEFEDEEDEFPSLSNLSDMAEQYDDLKFEDEDFEEEEGEENFDETNQSRKISINQIFQNQDNKNLTSSEFNKKIKQMQKEQKILPVVTLLKSVYEGRPSTIFFEYPDFCLKKRERANRTYTANPKEVKKWNLTYRMNDCNRPYQCVTKSFEAGGFVETTSNTQWNGYWASNRLDFIKKLNSFQKTNHFAGCWNLGRKDQLWIKVSKQKRRFNSDYDYIPRTLLLVSEYDRFSKLLEDSPDTLWIVKPVASCCGKGIHVIQKKCKISKGKRRHYLASEYISNPHLINNTKYDLRIYVLVTSYDPLRIYMFEDGLVRFATEKYDLNSSGHQRHRFMHLTNYSVNKKSENFVKNNDANEYGTGSKWSLKAWKEYLIKNIGEHGKNQLLRRMEDVIIKTCIAAEPFMNDSLTKTPQHRNNCFELYGFDILIDDTLKPWLLEVNVCPSLSSSSPLDRKIKTSLISDIFNTLGFIPYDKKKIKKEKKLCAMEKKKKPRYSINKISSSNVDQGNNILSPTTSSQIPSNQLFNPSTQGSNSFLPNNSNVIQPMTPQTQSANNTNGFQTMNGNSINSINSPLNTFNDDKRTFSKNVKDIQDLNEYNCLQKLQPDDWEVLFESDEEKYRSGEFKRIFPPDDLSLIDYYSPFFLFPRYNNIMLWNSLKCPVNLLEFICQKNSTINC